MMSEFTKARLQDAVRDIQAGIDSAPDMPIIPEESWAYIVRFVMETAEKPHNRYAAYTLMASAMYRRAYDGTTFGSARELYVMVARVLDFYAVMQRPDDADRDAYTQAYIKWRDWGFDGKVLISLLVELGAAPL